MGVLLVRKLCDFNLDSNWKNERGSELEIIQKAEVIIPITAESIQVL